MSHIAMKSALWDLETLQVKKLAVPSSRNQSLLIVQNGAKRIGIGVRIDETGPR